jgi:hypothetical protein
LGAADPGGPKVQSKEPANLRTLKQAPPGLPCLPVNSFTVGPRYSTDHRRSCEASSFTASQEIPPTFMKPEGSSPCFWPLVPILSQINQIPTRPSCFTPLLLQCQLCPIQSPVLPLNLAPPPSIRWPTAFSDPGEYRYLILHVGPWPYHEHSWCSGFKCRCIYVRRFTLVYNALSCIQILCT